MTKPEIISNEYIGKKRRCTQVVTYTRSDDLRMLADIEQRIENVEADIERETDPVSRARLKTVLDELEAELAEQQKIVDGYSDAVTKSK